MSANVLLMKDLSQLSNALWSFQAFREHFQYRQGKPNTVEEPCIIKRFCLFAFVQPCLHRSVQWLILKWHSRLRANGYHCLKATPEHYTGTAREIQLHRSSWMCSSIKLSLHVLSACLLSPVWALTERQRLHDVRRVNSRANFNLVRFNNSPDTSESKEQE